MQLTPQATSTASFFNDLFNNSSALHSWIERWQQRLKQESRPDQQRQTHMLKANPLYIPRNHQIERVIGSAVEGNLKPFNELMSVLSEPYIYNAKYSDYEKPPELTEVVQQTYCGT